MDPSGVYGHELEITELSQCCSYCMVYTVCILYSFVLSGGSEVW